MEVLQQAGVHIDHVTAGPGTFLLTHLHADHARLPGTVRGDVWCTTPQILQALHPHVRVRTLPLEGWIVVRGLRCYVFATHHAPFSCGFYFPALQLVHLGDGKMTDALLRRMPRDGPLHILYDALFESVPVPDADMPCDRVYAQLRAVGALMCRHYGLLAYVHRCFPDLTFRLDASVPPLVQLVAHHLGLVRARGACRLVGPAYLKPCVVPSAMWFRGQSGPPRWVRDGSKVRTFVNLHSTGPEIRRWKAELPQCTFVPLPTRPVYRGTGD